MPAINDPECQHLEQEGDSPGDGVRDVQTLGRMELRNLENGHDPANADTTDADHRQDHGNEGLSQAPQGTGGYVHHTTDEIEQADAEKPDHSIPQKGRKVKKASEIGRFQKLFHDQRQITLAEQMADYDLRVCRGQNCWGQIVVSE